MVLVMEMVLEGVEKSHMSWFEDDVSSLKEASE